VIVPIGDQLDRGGHGAQEATARLPVDAIGAGHEAGGKLWDPPVRTGGPRADDLTDLIGDSDPDPDKCLTGIGVEHVGGDRDHEGDLTQAMIVTQITLGDARLYSGATPGG
jgi:hypothetical protein